MKKNYSFFLFGARGTGKTTLLEKIFKNKAKFLDLLNPELESRFKRNPNILIEIVNSLTDDEKYIVIDKVQNYLYSRGQVLANLKEAMLICLQGELLLISCIHLLVLNL